MLYTVDKELNTVQTYATTYEDFLDMLKQQNKLVVTRIPTDAARSSKQYAMVKQADDTLPKPYSLNDDLSFEQKKSIVWNFLNLYRKSVDLRYESSISSNAIPLVEQFAAFSDSVPLNAIHVISCIFLVVVDSKSKTTLGAHIDSFVSAESITKVISAFLTELNIPKDEQKDYPLVCHLVGGNCETKEFRILKNIYESLSQFNIQLERSLVSDSMYPGKVESISYNPETATFHEAMLPTDNTDRSVQEIYIGFEDAKLKPSQGKICLYILHVSMVTISAMFLH